MKKYYGYTRVSTLKQGEGVSLQEQKEAIINFAKHNNLSVIEWFEEKVTAAKQGRPLFSKIIRQLRQGKADGLIIHKIDRGARNLKDWARLGDLIDANIDVRFANESLDLNSRGGRLSADIQAVVAADYIRNLREETRKGFYGRLKQGLYPLPAPLGYLDKGKGNPKEHDPIKAPLVKKVFELYSTNQYSFENLEKEIYKLGLRNSRGGRVTKSGFTTMLHNPFYIGIIKLQSTGETFQGIHKTLISKSLFDRVQDIIDRKTNTKIVKHDFLFRRMFACKYCGYSLIGETQKGYIYYRCHTQGCPTSCIKEKIAADIIHEKLSPVKFQDKELHYLKSKVARLRKEWASKKDEHSKNLTLQLNNLQSRLNRLTDAYIDRIIEKDLFENRKASLLMDKRSIEEKLAEIRENKASVPDKLTEFLELAESLYLNYEMRNPDKRRDLLNIVTSNRSVDGKCVEIDLEYPYQEVVNDLELINCAPHRDRPRTYYLDRLFDKLVSYFGSIEKQDKIV